MAYVEASAAQGVERERSDRAGGKTGVFTGAYAINPAQWGQAAASGSPTMC